MPRAWHRQREHTGELAIELWAPDLARLCAEAARALAEVLTGPPPLPATDRSAAPRIATVTAPDREALLVAWLNELIYRADVDHAAYPDVRVVHADDHALRAELRGVPLDSPRLAVKAATFHGLSITPSRGGLGATVILDV
jgi:SHS2 domain-containing protein